MFQEYKTILWSHFYGGLHKYNDQVGEFMIDVKEERIPEWGENAGSLTMNITYDGKRIYGAKISESDYFNWKYDRREITELKLARMILMEIMKEGVNAAISKL